MTDKQLDKYLRAKCAELGITILENASIRQIEIALEMYYKDAAIVYVGNRVEPRHTDKPTSEYTIEFTIYISRTLKAESEEAALEWLENCVSDCYFPTVGEITDMGTPEIIAVYKGEED